MITDLSTKSVFKCYRSDEHFREFYLQDDGKIQLEQTDVTVTLCIRRLLRISCSMR